MLEIDLNKFRKIGVPITGKYLDYEVIAEGKLYQIETKGTTQQYYSKMVKDIIEKKQETSNAYLRFGTVTTLQGYKFFRSSECIVVDDPPVEKSPVDSDYFENQLTYYAIYLSFILDSKYYNRYIKYVKLNKTRRVNINKNKFFTSYEFKGRIYFGECFDYRLIRKNIDNALNTNLPEKMSVFDYLTEKVGRTKFFIGLEEGLLKAINKKDRTFLEKYNSERILEDNADTYRFLDTDGILIIRSFNKADKQLEQVFDEKEVEKRIGFYHNYIRGLAHKCGAPCTSPSIQGKPCEIHTFREFCHWHR
ncbi:hypothetical protein [[Flexibacter] sp. ATCC 35208]|uniref:hypothetical protein n=1 Tax=[Flexibacter] sp. ATCC 35208 TaxID=1936242 RepID=UPI0009D1815C|nr:hypothetical protein [[Flexibacter] sp. ATCC 35208]OMP75284.1 hypothetical protein BW716_30865 [[Flexibacter] sp. ATCC 35208]